MSILSPEVRVGEECLFTVLTGKVRAFCWPNLARGPVVKWMIKTLTNAITMCFKTYGAQWSDTVDFRVFFIRLLEIV